MLILKTLLMIFDFLDFVGCIFWCNNLDAIYDHHRALTG